MQGLVLVVLLAIVAGCTVRKPLEREPISRVYNSNNRAEVINRLVAQLKLQSIPLRTVDERAGTIVTDSFDVLPEYCDCGLNFFGAEYPGERRGVMKINVTGKDDVKLRFDFHTLLRIRTNNKIVHCTSFGVLENKILADLDSTLRMAVKK